MSLLGQISHAWKKSKARQTIPEDGFGFHTLLIPKDGEASGTVDIVAIHGLNGNYMATWTDEKTGKIWLREFMTIPGVRVLSFSYNSVFQFSKSTSDIFDFADQLLEGLIAERRNYNEETRPIIFICHSLGGIIFKQALIRAYESDRYLSLRCRIAGVLFFGTPHRGSDMASWASIVGAILKAASLEISTNTQLSRDLEPKSRVLHNISRSFLERSRSIKIFSFFETEKLDFMKSLVVDRDSAVMGIDNEVALPIDGNHRTMCQFSSRTEPRFQPVISNLVDLVGSAVGRGLGMGVAMELLTKKSKILNWKQHKERNPQPVRGTCTWILEHPQYCDWLNGEESFLLWISADPGCGKSVLASYLIDHKMGLKKDDTATICYCFFKSDNHQQRSGAAGLQCLLGQLFRERPSLKSIGEDYLKDPESVENLDALWRTVTESAQQPGGADSVSTPRTICVLDGLDECDSSDQKKLVRLISETFQSRANTRTTYRDHKTPGVLKVLVLSRPDNVIKAAFDRTKPNSERFFRGPRAAMFRLRGEDQTDAISYDVSRVVEATISGLVNQGLPEELLIDMQSQLIRRADRTFLWTTLILQLLAEKVETGASRRELDVILKSRGIDAIYSELLAMRADPARARKMLSIMLAAARPLTTSELSIAMAVTLEHDALEPEDTLRRPDSKTFSDLEYDIVYPFETHLKSICGNFVRVIRNRVYLVHETAREFLLQLEDPKIDIDLQPCRAKSTDDSFASRAWADKTQHSNLAPEPVIHPWQNSFSMLECNGLLLQICTAFLYMMGKACNVSKLGWPSDKTKDFLQYAGACWTLHFVAVRDSIPQPDLRYYENLCHPRFPGFAAWTTVFSSYEVAAIAPIGRSEVELQNYYMSFLDIVAEEPQVDDLAEDPKPGWNSAREFLRIASSNPTSSCNPSFPMKVDEVGFVSLDLENKRRTSPLVDQECGAVNAKMVQRVVGFKMGVS